MEIKIVRASEVSDITILRPDMVTDVPPGVPHGFEAREVSDAIEIYWTVLSANDIDRGDSVGGLTKDD
jgi:hypothetical protein